ncbi:SIMPL domain-containing protein [Erysipelothrix urinaevulpis]|uniref:SIMPL domain-containing protein n=1 Tax=Erysipelothrix urinaevulpis TaxID=2683717 RepID=UPI001358EDDE|nr:SIMPL domain-containing protein [Erysipelothrix urinaevulpis]
MRTIKVKGSSQIFARPDSMELKFELAYENPLYGEALKSLRKDHLSLIRSLSDLGFKSDYLKTSAMNVQVLMAHDELPKRFRVSQRFVYRDKVDLDRLTNLLESMEMSEDLNFSIQYYSSKLETQVEEALILALKDAKAKAKVLALESDCKLHEIIEIVEHDEHYPNMLRTMQEDFLQTSPDDISIAQTITVTWSLK